MEQHNKLHLVPFGEYIPFRNVFPLLSEVIPIADFTTGKELTVFPGNFSVLICFEDTVARVARRLVNGGAQLLVNMTNDAWFLDSQAPVMHLQSAVFRTVENRRSLIRAANTGVSCFIDKFGRISRFVKDPRGNITNIAGYAVEDIVLSTDKTFYTKFGDIFTIICFGCILWGIIKK